jgi:hypothetical protein
MRNRDAQVRELFNHVRQAVDLLEDIMLCAPLREVQQNQETRPSPLPAPELPRKMAYSIKEVLELCAISRASLYAEIGQGKAANREAWTSILDSCRRSPRVGQQMACIPILDD